MADNVVPAVAGRAWQARGPVSLSFVVASLAALAVVWALLMPNNAGATGRNGSPSRAGGHYAQPNLGQWVAVTPVTNDELRDVYMLSANLGWAVGVSGTLLQYNGSVWQPQAISTTDRLVDVFMLSATNGYIVGWAAGGSADIFHYDGTNWSLQYPSPRSLSRIDGTSANNVWAVGLNLSLHWDGTKWTEFPLPVNRQLFAVAAISDTEAWAMGQLEPTSGHGLILHFTNGAWTQVLPSPGINTYFDGMFTAPNDGWAVGYSTCLAHYAGAGWSCADPNTYSVDRLSFLSSTEGWGVSSILNYIVHWDGTSFTQVPNPSSAFIAAVSMDSPYDGWIVGDLGAMLHYVDSSGATPTGTVAPSSTPTRTPSATPCAASFTDVHPSDYFYLPVNYLYCHGAIAGYGNEFRPYNNTTRGQLTKIVVLAERWVINTNDGPHFTDVPTTNVFYPYVETAFNRGIIAGYGSVFLPNNDVTRGQLCKIIVLAQQWAVDTTGGPHFTDVPTSNVFYPYVETAFNRGVVTGYGSEFRPNNSATRGQICKIVYIALNPSRSGVPR